jgi:uridine kinase
MTLKQVVNEILDARRTVPPKRSVLTAISGIDAGGKGYFTVRLEAELLRQGVNVVAIGVDSWLNIDRFDPNDPAEHYYNNSIRFEEMFSGVVLPLRENRSLQVEINYADELSTEYERRTLNFQDVDVILLEGIYLLKRAFRPYYDRTVWIDCSFETALHRAIARGQEGLPPEETTRDYRTIYNPAQRLHFQRDEPEGAASVVVNNDVRLGEVVWGG